MINEKYVWISFHIFYNGDFDELLCNYLRPLLKEMTEQELIYKFFFLRYWNGGDHIRLRLSVERYLVESVESLVVSKYNNFVKSKNVPEFDSDKYNSIVARMREFNEKLIKTNAIHEEIEELNSSGRIERRDYQFEYERYGGVHSRHIVESHFQFSSSVVLNSVESIIVSKNSRLTFGLYLISALFFSIQISKERRIELFENASRYIDLLNPDYKNKSFPELGFKSFEEQKNVISGVIASMEAAGYISGQSDEFNTEINLWRVELAERWDYLANLNLAGKLTQSPENIFVSFSHMLCNRLGIGLMDESYMYYLLSEALK